MPKRSFRRTGRRRNFIGRTLSDLGRRTERALEAEELAKVDGLLQRLDPRVKVAGAAALAVAVALSRNLKTIIGVLILAVVLALLSRVPLRTLAKRVWLGVFLLTGSVALPALFITPGEIWWRVPVTNWPVTVQGARGAAFLLARAETTATLVLLVVLCTPWTRVLKALSVLRVPGVVIVILGMTHRYIFLLLQTAREMFEARQSREVGRLAGSEQRRLAAASVGVLLSKSIYLSGEVYQAMRARGFSGEVRTLDDLRMSGRDWVAAALCAALTIAAVWAGR